MQTERTYELASIGDRLIALIVDSLIVAAIGGALGVGGGRSLFSGGILSFIIGAGYQWYFLTQQHGQTPGKMLMKLRVIKTNGTSISDVDAILRYLGYLINGTIPIGWLWALFDKNNQGWHDKIARTYVVKAEELHNDDAVYVYQADDKKKNEEAF